MRKNMGWSEFDAQEAREIQARIDKETSELNEQVTALTKERDQAIYRMQRIEAEELPNLVRELAAAQGREAKLRKALRNCYGLQGALDIPMIEATLNLPSNDTALQECIRAAQVAVLRDAARIPTRRWKGGPAGEAAIDIEAAISRMADELEKSK